MLALSVLIIACLTYTSDAFPHDTAYTELENNTPESIVVKLNGNIYENEAKYNLSGRGAIKACVWQYNNAYLSSLFSGTRVSFPEDSCISHALYEEANARILYEMKNKPNAWRGVDTYDFDIQIHSLTHRGDMAKVIIKRVANVYTNRPHFDGVEGINSISYGGSEGYVLKKEDGQWKLYNIIFATDFPTDTYMNFKKDFNPEHWENMYSFENCPRKTYEDSYNFSDYLIGDAENGQLDTSLMHLGNQ